MISESATNVLCPICAAENRRDAASCFVCDQSLAGAEVVAVKKSAADSAPAGRRPTFRLGSMMLLIAVVAVFLGLARMALELAVVFAILAIVAAFCTFASRGRDDSSRGRIVAYLVKFVLVVSAMIAGCMAGSLTCVMVIATKLTSSGNDNISTGLVLGGITGVSVAVWLTYVLVRKGHRAQSR